MPDTTTPLARECAVFARYLAGVPATPYVLQAYTRSHGRMPALAAGTPDQVDRMLAAFASLHPLATRMADGYARFLRPTGLLRQKLVLLLAVLESSPPAHDELNTAVVGSLPLTLARLALAGAGSVLAILAGIVVLGPAHLALSLGGRGGKAA